MSVSAMLHDTDIVKNTHSSPQKLFSPSYFTIVKRDILAFAIQLQLRLFAAIGKITNNKNVNESGAI